MCFHSDDGESLLTAMLYVVCCMSLLLCFACICCMLHVVVVVVCCMSLLLLYVAYSSFMLRVVVVLCCVLLLHVASFCMLRVIVVSCCVLLLYVACCCCMLLLMLRAPRAEWCGKDLRARWKRVTTVIALSGIICQCGIDVVAMVMLLLW